MEMPAVFCDELILMRNAFFGFDERTGMLGTKTGLAKDEFEFVMRKDIIEWYNKFVNHLAYNTVPKCMNGVARQDEVVQWIKDDISKMDEWQLHQFRIASKDPVYMHLLELANKYEPKIRLKLARNIDKMMQIGFYKTDEEISKAEMSMAALLAVDEKILLREMDDDVEQEFNKPYVVKRNHNIHYNHGINTEEYMTK